MSKILSWHWEKYVLHRHSRFISRYEVALWRTGLLKYLCLAQFWVLRKVNSCWNSPLSSSELYLWSRRHIHSTSLGSVCCRVSSLKLLFGSLLMSCRPCDRCYSCQPGTVHWGHAVIALDATLNGLGKRQHHGWAKVRRYPQAVTDIWSLLFHCGV